MNLDALPSCIEDEAWRRKPNEYQQTNKCRRHYFATQRYQRCGSGVLGVRQTWEEGEEAPEAVCHLSFPPLRDQVDAPGACCKCRPAK